MQHFVLSRYRAEDIAVRRERRGLEHHASSFEVNEFKVILQIPEPDSFRPGARRHEALSVGGKGDRMHPREHAAKGGYVACCLGFPNPGVSQVTADSEEFCVPGKGQSACEQHDLIGNNLSSDGFLPAPLTGRSLRDRDPPFLRDGEQPAFIGRKEERVEPT